MASKLEYLQRYMAKGSETMEKKLKKKRKKEKPSGSSSLRIVDGDHDWAQEAPTQRNTEQQWELDAEEDEAPVVVANGEIDPEDMPAIANAQEYQEELQRQSAHKKTTQEDPDLSPPRRRRGRLDDGDAKDSDRDASPPRRGRDSRSRGDSGEGAGDASPPRRRPQGKSDADASPPPRRAPATLRAGDDDASPPRRRSKALESGDDASPPRRRARARDSDGDASPPRRASRTAEKKDDDASPPRRRHDAGARERSPVRPSSGRDKRSSRSRSRGRRERDRRGRSPPRRDYNRRSPSRSRGRSRRSERRRSRSPSVDRSRDRHRQSASPRRGSRSRRRSSTPEDRKPRHEDRRSRHRKSKSRSASPPRSSARTSRKREVEDDASPPRKSQRKASEDQPIAESKPAPVETAAPAADEYKPRAGLFTATEFAEDLKKKTAHNDLLRGAKAEDMGQNAETVYRDKKGRKLDMLNEMVRQQELMEGKAKREAKEEYEWGTGRVQKEERLNQQELLDKMKSAPFARRNDDEELEKMRRERVRAFDPMNSKVFQDDSLFSDDTGKKKKSKKSKSKKTKAKTSSGKPKYAGPPAPPNRFGVQPGYRWDGVVRGTSWEEKLMMRANTQHAVSDEAYRYAVADM